MINIPNYQITEQIYESSNSLVYRGLRQKDKQPVILKVLKEDYPSPEELTRYRQEYDIMCHLADLDGVVKVCSIDKHQNKLLMCLEDFGGEPLRNLAQERQFTVEELLKLFINATEILGQIHQKNVIHKDINPANLVYNSTTGMLKIIDFGIATQLSRQHLTLKNPDVLEGTLAYLSPEQTGRMNRALDYHTDFYSLGVTFYELFAGKLPFESKDAMELVHCHIAKQPIPPNQINTNVPDMVSNIIMKLLEKTAEERYQSAWGLKADLEKCQENLTGLNFELGQQDFSERLQIPQKLYGREAEVDTLLSSFEQIVYGTAEIMLVAGYSGVGKSVLVKEIYKLLTQKKGYFITGKFDQLQRNIPYSAIVNAFKELVQLLLTENEEQLAVWREKLLTALGPNGQVIIDVIPEIEIIIGQQPSIPQLGPTESQNRFHLVFQNFMQVCCLPEHPLVMFLDDLQWADSATLKLLELIMTDQNITLFLIGAYRDNEVDSTHSLMMTLEKLRKENIIVNQITLKPLTFEQVNQLIVDSLHQSTVSSLTDLVMRKTGGNPFFVNQFLHTLDEEGLLNFVPPTLDQKSYWQWDINQIESINISDNIVELMIAKLKKLPESAQQVLRLAACVGNRFDLDTLSIIYQKPATDIFQCLMPVLSEGLILPISEPKISSDNIHHSQLTIHNLQFSHDRIQQAAYALIDEEQKQAVHLQTGRLLLKSYTKQAELEEKLFDIINQFNKGLTLIDTPEEQVKVAELNLQAGQKARASSAHEAAVRYFTVAQDVLPANAFQQYYDLTFEVYKALAKSYYIVNDFDSSEKLYPILLDAAQSMMDKVSVYAIQMDDYHLQGDYERALQVQKAGLRLLGINVPDEDEDLEKLIEEELQLVPTYLAGRKIEDLVNAPEMESEEYKAILQILIGVWITAYLLSHNTIVQWSSVKMSNLCLQHGNSDLAAFAYIQYGFVCIDRLQEFKTGYQFGEVAKKVSDQYDNLDIRGKVYFMFGLVINHWQKHVNLSTESFKKGYLFSVEGGDWTYAGYAAANIVSNLLITGHSCQSIYEQGQGFLNFLQNKSSEGLTHFFLPGGFCALLNLLGKTKDTSTFDCEYVNEAELHKTYHDLPIVMGWFYSVKIRSLYWFRNYAAGAKVIEQADTVAIGVPSQVKIPEAYFYSCLMLIAADELITDPEKKAYYWRLFDKYHAKIKIWAEHCPDNYEHKYLLIEAEKARFLGKDVGTVLPLYEQAIESAKKYHYPNNEALAHELTARFWLSRGNESYAKTHLTEARYGYQLWGATAKVKDLEAQYPHFLAQKIAIPTQQTTTKLASTTMPSSTRMITSTSVLDLESVMKASQTLSGEIVLKRLLEKMMQIVIENAGAQNGFLLLPKNDKWFIEGSGHGSEITVLQSLSIKDSEQVSVNIIYYVVRTKENIVLNNATQEGKFTRDPYIVKQRPQSILCMPLLNQGLLIGILYLENNLTTGAFTSKRIETLNLLSSQLAISIENSLLYNNLEHKVAERTQELSAALDNLKTTQSQLVESEKMASLGGLVAGVAHEINTPIGIGVTAASTLFDRTAETATAYENKQLKGSALKAYFDIAKSSSNLVLNNLNRAADLIQSFKQVAVDQSNLDKRTFAVKQYIETSLLNLKPHLKKTSHKITVNGDEQIEINSYPGAFSQIITNLVMNSVNHAYPIEKSGNLSFKLKLDSERLIIEYSDDGCGIPPENLDKIFEPFFTTARMEGGTGLGLHIVFNLSQKLNGTIKVQSEVGVGTTFILNLPLS